MSYDFRTDFMALVRNTPGGERIARIPGADYVVSALYRLGMIRLWVSQTPPISEQSSTAWFKPAIPSWSAEGTLYLWDAVNNAYAVATPELWNALLLTATTDFIGATAGADGARGLVPAPLAGQEGMFLKASGGWATAPSIMPGGSDTQVQYNFAGALAGAAGALIVAGELVLNTPDLGTPTAVNLVNGTGLPLGTGVTGNLSVGHLAGGAGASARTVWTGDGSWSDPRDIPVNSYTGARILAATDVNALAVNTTGGWTLNAGIAAVKQAFLLYNDSNANQTLTIGGGVTAYLGGSRTTGNRTLAGGAYATAFCYAADTFFVSGPGVT